MKRRSRELQIFSLSALDVLAMATGAFVLISVILLPYYRKTLDAQAAIEDVRVATSEQRAEAEEILRAAAAERAAAESLLAEANSLSDQAAAARAAAASRERQAATAAGRAADNDRQVAELKARIEQKIVKQLDLVFVVDTTASMTGVLEEMSLSMSGIIRVLERLVPSLRVAVVGYRDHDLPGQLLSVLPPTSTDGGAAVVQTFVDRLEAFRQGGRTPQEALYEGLGAALSMPLRSGAKQSIIVIGDAAPHDAQWGATLDMAARFARGGQRHSLSTLFVPTESWRRFGRGDREYFAELAKAGGGAFADHSGALMEGVLLSVLED